ncbi:hypothetical protein [Sphaerisporangium fuscum]|uniref:hypothetical protein n=1 Tax=Sphaerisporangium fuscum TaxID=2835868 RepID=UPI001BDC1AC8|nr:hypothetical protein [Sphaerisporangium fuscum]
MGYPGDRQPRRQPYRPYETGRPAGDLRPEAQPHEHAAEPPAWPGSDDRDPTQRPWSRAEEPQGRPQGAPSGGDLWSRGQAPERQAGPATETRQQPRGLFEPYGEARPSGPQRGAFEPPSGSETRQSPSFEGLGRPAFEGSRTPGRPFAEGTPGHPYAEGTTGRPYAGEGPAATPSGPGNDEAVKTEEPSAKPPAERRRSEPEPAPRQSRAPIFVAGGVLALIVAVVVAVVVMSRSGGTADLASPARPTGHASAPLPLVGGNGDKYGLAASRKTDPQPLTLKEIFGQKKVTVHGSPYYMTVSRSDKKCKDAVHGADIQKALKAGDCTQFLRASFRDRAGKLIGTVGVANLKNVAAVKKAEKAASGSELKDYVSPLQGKDSATKMLGGAGDSFATAWPQGHYLVMLWFQYKDGHKPSKAELKQLNRAAVGITENTVFTALDTRALTGARSN